MKRIRSLLVVLCSIVGLGIPAWAETTVSHFLLRNESVGADFLSVDTSTCSAGIETFVNLQGGLFGVRDGSTTETPFTSVTVNVFDHCRNATLLSASGDTTTQDLRINPNLKSASLQATVPLHNETSGSTIFVHVDLVWNGTNKADRNASNDVYRSGDITLVSWSQGAIREAEAAGSIILDCNGEPSCSGIGLTDVTPLPSFDGFIERDGARETTITVVVH